MIDFHTHILPNIDDGSKSVETSIEMLKQLENDGVKLVCLTSHFYASHENISDYLERRKTAIEKLNYTGKLDIRVGAEIRYYKGMSHDEDLSKLCLEGTNILLIELPFTIEITNDIINEIIKIKLNGYDVVLAHIERYKIKDEFLEYLHNSGVRFQMNTSCVMGFFTKKKAFKLIENHYISYLGSDCHNLTSRPPLFLKAIEVIKQKFHDQDISLFIDRLYNIN